MIKFLSSMIFIFIITSKAFAADFYVDPSTGSMDNDGSKASPWSTLQEVLSEHKIDYQKCRAPCPSVAEDRKYYRSYPNAPVKAGDTINLMGGYHGVFSIINAYNTDYVYIKAVDGQVPTLTNIFLRSVSHWSFDGLSISPEHGGEKKGVLCLVQNHSWTGPSDHVTLKNSSLFSISDSSGWVTKDDWKDNAAKGVYTNADYTVLENLDIKNVTYGVTFYGAHHSSLRNSTITNICMDGIWSFGSDYGKVEYNVVKNIFLVALAEGAHYDLFQTATVGGKTQYGLELRGNIFIAHTDPNQIFRGSVQGIGMFDGWYEDFIIENNLVISDSYHGITLTGAINCKVINNTVQPSGISTKYGAPIGIYPHKKKDENGVRIPGYGNIIANNIAEYLKSGSAGGAEVITNNIWTKDKAAHFVNPDNFDYHLLSSSSAIGGGTSVNAPLLDIRQINRGNPPDVGAFQYITKGETPAPAGFTISK